MQKLDFFKKKFFPIKIRIINLISILLEYTIKKRGLKFPRFLCFFIFWGGGGGGFRFILPTKTQDLKQWETKP